MAGITMLIIVDVSLLWCMFFRFLKCAHGSVGTMENDIGETLIIFATLQLRIPKSIPGTVTLRELMPLSLQLVIIRKVEYSQLQ